MGVQRMDVNGSHLGYHSTGAAQPPMNPGCSNQTPARILPCCTTLDRLVLSPRLSGILSFHQFPLPSRPLIAWSRPLATAIPSWAKADSAALARLISQTPNGSVDALTADFAVPKAGFFSVLRQFQPTPVE